MSWPVSFPHTQRVAPFKPAMPTGASRLDGVPWIEVGNGLCASSVALLALYGAGMGMVGATVSGLAAWAGWKLAFGSDAVAEDVYAGVRGMSPSEVAAVIAACERDLARIRAAIASLPEGAEAFCVQVDAILARFRRQPSSVASGRRFVDIYLDGVAVAAEKYVELSIDGVTPESEASMRDLLAAAVGTAAAQRAALRSDAQLDLDLDVQVLRSRMGAELPMPAVPYGSKEGPEHG